MSRVGPPLAQVDVEVAVRADKQAESGDRIPVRFSVRFAREDGTQGVEFHKEITLTVVHLTEENNPSTFTTSSWWRSRWCFSTSTSNTTSMQA